MCCVRVSKDLRGSIPATKYPERRDTVTEKERVIAEIQQYLRNIARSVSDEPTVIPDGIYSDDTKRAVSDFQRSVGLAETGVTDYATFDALVKENRRVISESRSPKQVMPIKNSDLPLYYGMENEFVEKLKIMLNSVADKHGNFRNLERNAVFDRETENEVKRWQKVVFTEENGVVDKFTWNTLSEYYLIK